VTLLAKITISLVPVLGFLAVLVVLDSYKLVKPLATFATILAGAFEAVIALLFASLLLRGIDIDLTTYSQYLAPAIEETIKALFVIILFRLNRVGFMVDAAILGFAVGAGFALVENVYYLLHVESTSALLWVIRGFGTSAMHATTMSVFAVIARSRADQRRTLSPIVFVPALVVAILIHSLFNHFVLSPTMSTIAILIVLPLLIVVVFERSERSTRKWLGVGFDADQELMRILTTGEFSNSRIGEYLESLRTRFPGRIVADMFCYLTLHTELALRAKGLMLMREAGIEIPHDPEILAKLEEMRYLQRSIGKTGAIALQPVLHTSSRDLWQLKTLG
jgi:RsiW-degrading membrane proteinase PrsW (M82 family)